MWRLRVSYATEVVVSVVSMKVQKLREAPVALEGMVIV